MYLSKEEWLSTEKRTDETLIKSRLYYPHEQRL